MKQASRLLYLLLVFTILSKPTEVEAQDEKDYGYLQRTAMSNPVISPPPTASGLGKYVEIPVGLYTGVPNINTPLYEIKTKNGYTLPISLSYHASGIKVQQRAGNIGIGWSLNAGGVITRVVRGVADDQDSICTDTDYTVYLHDGGKLFHPGPYTKDSIWTCDVESDEYVYNFNGYSGKFYFDDQNNIVHSGNQQELDISWQGDSTGIGIPQFTIIAQDGIKYIFNTIEVITDLPTKAEYVMSRVTPWYQNVDEGWTALHENQDETNLVDSLEAPHFRHITSWYLTEIDFPNTDEDITFTYDRYRYNYVEKTGEVNRYGYEYDPAQTINIQYWTYKASLIDGAFLTRIDFHNGHVSFVANEDTRLDVYDSETEGKIWYNDLSGTSTGNYYESFFGQEPYLDSIKVVSDDGETLKAYHLKHNYFESPGADTASSVWEHLFYRLRLDSIQEVTDADKPPYVFTYDTDSLPFRYDSQVDFWGFYNANGASNQIPKLYVDSTYNNDSSIFRSIYAPIKLKGFTIGASSDTITGADRNATDTINQACVLKQITYPIGGWDEFEYETNQFKLADSLYLGGGLRIKSINTFAAAGDTAKSREYFYVDNQDSCSGKIINFPLFARFYTYDGTHRVKGTKYWAQIKNLIRQSNSLCDLGSTKGSIIGYSDVEVRHKEGGKERYTFSLDGTLGETVVKDEDSGDTIFRRHINALYIPPPGSGSYPDTVLFDHAPFIPDMDYDWNRGQLLTKEIYDGDDNLLKRIENSYELADYTIDTVWYKGRGAKILGAHTGSYAMTYANYQKLRGWNYLSSSKEITFDQGSSGDSITITTYFKKNSDQLLTEQGLINSNGDSLKTKYTYTSDESSEPYLTMVEDYNLINYPTKVEKRNDNTFLESRSTTYKAWATGVYAPQYEIQKVGTSSADTLVEYTDYDDYLNPLSLTKSGDRTQCFIWGYDTTYPIASIVNAGLNEVYYNGFEESGGSSSSTAYTGNKVKSLSDVYEINKSFTNGTYVVTYFWRAGSTSTWGIKRETKTYSGVNLNTDMSWGQIDEVRVHPADAQMTTYTYEPLVGMTSQTDPNGQTTYYEYDDTGRLIRIRDANQDLVQEIDYHFATQ